MKFIGSLLILTVVAVNSAFGAGNYKCALPLPTVPTGWIDIEKECSKAIRDQIQVEIDASFKYLAMGAHFSKDTVNRPGFAEFFFGAAKEEREHATHLIDYLTMRGQLSGGELTDRPFDIVTNLIKVPKIDQHSWKNGAAALKAALDLEADVTKAIRGVIEKCEKNKEFNDYHLVDYLTGVYLEEQYKGQRELAGKLSTLNKMMDNHKELGEFLFDKNNLSD